MSSFNKENYLEKQSKIKKEMKETLENITNSFKKNAENIIEYLVFSSRFYNYSERNNRLIMAQNKNVSFIASFSYFQKLGYKVKKGEKSIKILAPYECKFVKLRNDVLKPLSSFTKEEQKEYLKNSDMIIKKTLFKYVSVFDISQTDCPKEEYPKIISMGYSSKHHDNLYNILKRYAISKGIDVVEQSLNSIYLKGRYIPSNNEIKINNILGDTEKLSTLAHELGHAILHNDKESKNKPSYQIELEADCFSILMYIMLNLSIDDSTKRHFMQEHRKFIDSDSFDIDKTISYVYSKYCDVMHDIEDTLIKEISIENEIKENNLDNKLPTEKEVKEKVIYNDTYSKYDSQRELEEIKNINILEIATNLGYTLQKKGELYNLKEHDSLVIYPKTNSFYQFSTGNGGSVIDLYMNLSGNNLKDSIKQLKDYVNISSSHVNINNSYKECEENKKLELPKKSSIGYKNMFAYLIKQRCIDPYIVTDMMKRKYIYQDENRNVVFVSYNKSKEPVCATKRSTNTGSNFKGDVLGSDKSNGFYIDNKSETLFVTEAPIDILSIMTFQNLKGNSYKENNYLALLGASNYKALENTLNNNKSISKVILCMDNDKAGRKSLEELKQMISEKYKYVELYQSIPKQKDFNEDLVMYINNVREVNKSIEKIEENQISI